MTGISGVTPNLLNTLIGSNPGASPSAAASGSTGSSLDALLSFNFQLTSFSTSSTNIAGLKTPSAMGDSEVLAAQVFAALDKASDANRDSQVNTDAARRSADIGARIANLAAQAETLAKLAAAQGALEVKTADLNRVTADKDAQTVKLNAAQAASAKLQTSIDELTVKLAGIDKEKSPEEFAAVQAEIAVAAKNQAAQDDIAIKAAARIKSDQADIGAIKKDIVGLNETIAALQSQLIALAALFASLSISAQADASRGQGAPASDPQLKGRDLVFDKQLDVLLANAIEASKILAAKVEGHSQNEDATETQAPESLTVDEAATNASATETGKIEPPPAEPQSEEDLKQAAQLAAGLALGLATVIDLLRAQSPIPVADPNSYGLTQNGRLNLAL